MIEATQRLPVTLLSGFQAVGKTSLLNHLVATCAELRLALIVPPASAQRLELPGPARDRVAVHVVTERYEARGQGRDACQLRADLLPVVDRIARQGRADCLVIESPALAPPLPVAQTFAFRDPSDYCLGDVARLDTLVTVLDAGEFLPEYLSGNVLEQPPVEGEADEATSPHLLALQVECCNVLVLNKADRVGRATLERLALIGHHLNPDARVVPARFGRVPASRLVRTGLFDLAEAKRSPGWQQQLRGAYVADCPVRGVHSFVYRARRPFHPRRLWALIQAGWPGVLECKGYFWLATRIPDVGGWSQCGPVCHVTRLGRWWADVPPERWPESPAARERIDRNWEEPFGDRRQELVIIGAGLDPGRVRASLDECLLTEPEMELGPEGWALLQDPFPCWQQLSLRSCGSLPTMIRNH